MSRPIDDGWAALWTWLATVAVILAMAIAVAGPDWVLVWRCSQ